MTAGGSTNSDIGLRARLAVPGRRRTVPDPPGQGIRTIQYQEVIILLTDGLNTQDRWYGNGSDTSTQVDDRQKLTCATSRRPRSRSIRCRSTPAATRRRTLLKNCASSTDKFFLLTSANAIITTFNQIGTALSNLRVAK